MGCGVAGKPVTSSYMAAILTATLDFTKLGNLTGKEQIAFFFH